MNPHLPRLQNSLPQLQNLLPAVPGIRAALLIGSQASGDAGLRSDVNVSLLIDSVTFSIETMSRLLQETFPEGWIDIVYVPQQGKLAAYFHDRPKLDFGLYEEPTAMMQHFPGSAFEAGREALWFDTPDGEVENAIQMALSQPKRDRLAQARACIARFLREFEQASAHHARCDSYRQYVCYNMALQQMVELQSIVRGHAAFAYLPHFFRDLILDKPTRMLGYNDLAGSLFLADSNDKKRRLLDFFYDALARLPELPQAETARAKSFCEAIYQRDYLWNFRDAAALNPALKPGKIFRTSSPTRYQEEAFFQELLAAHRITGILDLRSHDEIKENPYLPETLSNRTYFHAPIDPRQPSEAFQASHGYGSRAETVYRYFAHEAKAAVKRSLELILTHPADEAIAIHCFAGKDRTGFIVALLHLLLGTEWEIVEQDYLASGGNSQPLYLGIIREAVNEAGGIEAYLIGCGVRQDQLEEVRQVIGG